MGEAVGGPMATSDAMLLGRNTYQAFRRLLAGSAERCAAVRLDERRRPLRRLQHLEKGTWEPTTIISGDVKAQIEAVKAGPGQDIQVIGSPTLVASLLDMGVLDELSLLIHPVVVGKGKRLFDATPFGPAGKSPLKLLSTNTFRPASCTTSTDSLTLRLTDAS